MRRIAVIPAYEPPESFVEYASQVLQVSDELIVVNDGSGFEYDFIFKKIKKLRNVTVLSCDKNMGKGYALKMAFSYCMDKYSPEDVIITADCDGQHSVSDVASVSDAAVQNSGTCVLGARDFTHTNVPARSKAGNTQMLRLLRLLFSLELTDSQTGLRAFSVKTAKEFLKVSGNRFEYETGMLIYAKRNHIPIQEVPIKTIYPDNKEEHNSHFKTFRDSLRVGGIMLHYLFGSIISALLALIADLGVFSLLIYVVFPKTAPVYTLIASIIGKIISSLINFGLNCKYVFHGKAKRAIGRYYTVWACQLILSYVNLCLFGHVLGCNLTLIKLIGDCALALLSYRLQCNWVYEITNNPKNFYGNYARFGRWLLRTFSSRYESFIVEQSEPVVYVCRHLNMHGPFTTLKWLPFHVHPLILHVFFDRKNTAKHMSEYTFAARYGKPQKRFCPAAHILSWVAPPMMRSLKGVPVYRDGTQTITTFRCGLKYLLNEESLIVYPDIEYTGSYDNPSEIYDGFLYLGEMYYKKTGKQLKFIPLTIDDNNRRILEGEAVVLCNYRCDVQNTANAIKNAINL